MQSEMENYIEWQIRTIKTARKKRPPTVYIADRYFETGSLSIVYGAPGSFKSMLIADLCCAVVHGSDWLPGVGEGGKGIKTIKGGVLWYDYDNGTKRTDERFDAMSIAPGRYLDDDDPLYYVSMPTTPFIADDVESTLRLVDTATGLKVSVIVIDNLGLVTGEVEENSARMAHVMGNLRIVAERTGCAVIVIHHQRKGGAGQSRAGDALRGHSSIEAALDLAIQVTREPNSQAVTIRSTKTRGVDVPQVQGYFNFDHRAGTRDLETAWFSGIESKRGTNPIREEVIAVVKEHVDIGKGRLADVVKERLGVDAPGINNIRNWINDLIDVEGILTTKKKGRTIIVMMTN